MPLTELGSGVQGDEDPRKALHFHIPGASSGSGSGKPDGGT